MLAATGLLLALGALVYWTAYEITLIEREETYTQARLDAVGARVQPYDPMAAFSAPPTPTPAPSPNDQALAEEQRQALQRAVRALGPFNRFRAVVNVVSVVAEVVGLCLSLVGFTLWYPRVCPLSIADAAPVSPRASRGPPGDQYGISSSSSPK